MNRDRLALDDRPDPLYVAWDKYASKVFCLLLGLIVGGLVGFYWNVSASPCDSGKALVIDTQRCTDWPVPPTDSPSTSMVKLLPPDSD